ncbi:DUF924 family protein [Pseudoroseicyclus tamaricis]|uniref:DUF924 domain-containing protein n=1 Tax=Pseudoroseicyclus tamaricis TaxID=2705421 RepID=A0A6B2JV04_9RHOB|nr:DUF924 family protein [Pseudoroseicyclus tamaricis]NDV00459.1 DUF924 domain-containing protein [Pseudoroseicyclus tamaricis]
MSGPDDVLKFWLDECSPKDWYGGGPELDAEITERFQGLWSNVMDGIGSLWLTYPSGCLAYIILTDQFPRNMFRGTSRAFASDHLALEAAISAIGQDYDLRIDAPARCFFYMPLEHSENHFHQDRAVRLFKDRLDDYPEYLLHACAHREVIRRFGRFPFRNEALGRTSSPEEADWLANGGYMSTVNALREEEAHPAA